MSINEVLDQAFEALENKHYAEAADKFQTVLAADPTQVEALHYLAVCQHALKNTAQARDLFIQAAQLNPSDADIYHNFFTCGYELYGQGLYAEAIAYFSAIIELNMDNLEQSWIYLARSLRHSNQANECANALNQAVQRYPNNFPLRLENTFLFPQIYFSTTEIEGWRKRFLQKLSELDSYLQPERIEAIQARGIDCDSPLFGIFAQGLNERETTQEIGRIWEKMVPVAQSTPPPRLSASDKIRIGMVSPSFWNHSTMHYFLGVIQTLAQEKDLELTAFYLGGNQQDAITDRIKATDSHFEILPWHLDPCLEILNRCAPDILLYLDIGQDPFLYSLASNRMAPVQCAMTGLPMTSGLHNLDYYLSGKAFEAPQAQAHYSEKLVLFEGPIVTYLPPPTPERIKTRTELSLPEDRHLYLFPMTLFRVDPEFEQIIPEILRRDSEAEWLFISYRGLEKVLLEHYQGVFPELCDRIHFLPWLSQPDFLSLMAQVDVIMDSLRLGAGNLAFQAFWMDTPLVTLPSEFLRCRIGTGLYQLMGLDDGIAHDQQDYIEKALKIATQPAYRQDLRQRIRARKQILFNNPIYTQEMAAWFRTVHASKD